MMQSIQKHHGIRVHIHHGIRVSTNTPRNMCQYKYTTEFAGRERRVDVEDKVGAVHIPRPPVRAVCPQERSVILVSASTNSMCILFVVHILSKFVLADEIIADLEYKY